MTEAFVSNSNRWDIPGVILKKTRQVRNKTFQAPFGMDDPEKCELGKEYWHTHPVQNFDYKFNGWGCRDHDYDQYLKENSNQLVNLCIGDSYTMNIGGPQEHSWPQLLEDRLGVPSVNIANDGMSSYYFRDAIDKIKSIVNVDQVFVLYNALDDSGATVDGDPTTDVSMFEQKLEFLKQHCWVHNAHWQFIPPSSFSPHLRKSLYYHFPTAHEYIKNVKLDLNSVDFNLLMTISSLREKYYELKGPSWPDYENLCKLLLQRVNVMSLVNSTLDTNLLRDFVINYFSPFVRKILLASRDGIHMNKYTNQLLADYFYQQCRTIKLI